MIIKVDNQTRVQEFINLPSIMYENDPNWVKPLVGRVREEFNPRLNPVLRYHDMELYLSTQDDVCVGRVAAFVDQKYNEIHNARDAFFGFFECINDASAAAELLSTVESFAKARNMKNIIGPVDFSTNYQSGLLLNQFSRPTVMTPYNKDYYPQLVESAGYSKLIDLFSYNFNKNEPIPDRLLRTKAVFKKRRPEISIKPLSLVYGLNKPQILTDLYNEAFSCNWGYIPMTTKEFTYFLGGMTSLRNTDLNYIAFVDNTPVGLLLTVPDVYSSIEDTQMGVYSKRKLYSGIRITVLGVLPSYRNRAIDILLGVTALEDVFKKGYETIEFSVILETNTPMINLVNREFGIPANKTYRVYQKAVN